MKEDFSWVSHPFVEDYPRSIFSLIVIVFLPIFVLLSFQDIYMTIFTFLVLLLSLIKYFFRTSYILSQEYLIVRFLGKETKKQWSYYKNYQIDKKGIYLSPYRKDSLKWGFVGTFLRFNNNKDAVINSVKEKLERNGKMAK